jgi:3-phosphoglycerate kinase
MEGTQQEEPAEEEEDTGPTINSDHFVLGYGPKSIEAIKTAIKQSFKLFWDGSIGMFLETALSSSNNKEALKVLLDLRRCTDKLEEPPVTFMHGIESELLLRHTLM